MKHSRSLSGSAAVLIFAGGAACADVTASDVWEAWQASAASVGQTLTPGSQSQDGGTLNISDLQVAMSTDSVDVSGTIPSVTMTENGDGTVTIELSDSYPMTIVVDVEEEDTTVEVPMTVESSGMRIVASGDPGTVTYDYQADMLQLVITEVIGDGETMAVDASIALSGLSGNYSTTEGENAKLTANGRADEMAIIVGADEPEGGGGRFDVKMIYSDLTTRSAGAFELLSGGVTDLSDMLKAGAETETSVSHGSATYDIQFQDGRDQFSLQGKSDSGILDIALSKDSLSYEIGNTGLDMTMSGSEIPLPEIAFSIGEVGVGLLMPVSASEDPQDFGLGITLAGLSVSEMIWGMVDPGGQLPHDPATLIIDLTGKANFLFDIFNPDSAMEVQAAMPAEIHELNLNEVRLALVGSELSGTGAFTFDMENLETFEGMPAPTGKLNLQLVGANALIDKLVAMGLVPEDQAMGARMMMGLFARPGDGPDTLVSEIEVDGATGAVSANGQRLQ